VENALTRVCRLQDSFKELLFNAVTTEQEERARKLLDYEDNLSKKLYVN
jgi:hypothetical protein